MEQLQRRLSAYFSMVDDSTSSQTVNEESHHHDRKVRHSVYEVIELDNRSRSFQEQFKKIRPTAEPRALVLVDFVDTSSQHDVYSLRDLLYNGGYQWKKVHLVDSAPKNSCRRWRYKKDNVCHHIKDICVAREIALVFEASTGLLIDGMSSVEPVVDILKQLEQDEEIIQLALKGSLNDQETALIFQALTSLLTREDRTWDRVRIEIVFGGGNPRQYLLWKQLMDEYATLYAQMQVEYNIAIEVIRPYPTQPTQNLYGLPLDVIRPYDNYQ